MAKRSNKYNLVLTQVTLANGDLGNHLPLDITFENHDEISVLLSASNKKTHSIIPLRPRSSRSA